MNEPESKVWKTWNPGSDEPSWVKERFIDGPSPGGNPGRITSEFEVTVQNPEVLYDLFPPYTPDRAAWVGPAEDLPAGARDVTLFEAPRPLNRAGRRARARGKL